MNDRSKYEKAFGLDMPMDKAVKRFGEVTKAELEAEGAIASALVAEGEVQEVLFKEVTVRKVCHNDEWWFAVVDVIAALTASEWPSRYWTDLKRRMAEKEGFSELYAKIAKLPYAGPNGKMYQMEAANTETVLRILQSVPSPRAEPFKRWLAKVGYERIQETQDPEILIKRAILTYQLQGRSDDWIEKRIRSIVVRKELTSEWKKRGVEEGGQYATLTNMISTGTFGGITVAGHMSVKGLSKGHNLRDHMTDLELIFTMLGEKSTAEIAKARDAQGFTENKSAARAGGAVAGSARRQLETETNEAVVSTKNFLGVSRRNADPQALTHKGKALPSR